MEISVPKRIGDLAKAGGVGVETVRFYEREGLIDQPLKPFRGWREYDDVALAQLGHVRLAQRIGLSLSDAKRLKKKAGGPQPQFCTDVRETVTARLAAVEAEISDLTTKQGHLRSWLDHCNQNEGQAECPLYVELKAVLPLKS
jgi:MerR family mercuric resistance operon transcriptional regulator